MIRDFENLQRYLTILEQDIYDQPEDTGHKGLFEKLYREWIKQIDYSSVLDVGCGTGFAQDFFAQDGKNYMGVTLGSDAEVGAAAGRDIIKADFTFLNMFNDNEFDLVLSRHSLEHSPMPLLTLMEWNRVTSAYLCLVVPAPEHFGWVGKNHYSVMHREQVEAYLRRAKFDVVWDKVVTTLNDDKRPIEFEYWYLARKRNYKNME